MQTSTRLIAASTFILFGFCQSGFADENYIEFNDDFIFGNAGNKSTINVAQYAHGNPVKAGTYTVSVSINGKAQQTTAVQFIENNTPNATPCLTRTLLEEASIDISRLPAATEGDAQCYDWLTTTRLPASVTILIHKP